MRNAIILIFFFFVQFYLPSATAGIDIPGHVKKIQVTTDGTLWFSIDSPDSEKFCKPYWYDLNMYITKDDPQYVYYYGLLTMAFAKEKYIMIANINIFDGTRSCDIGKTGYGIVVIG